MRDILTERPGHGRDEVVDLFIALEFEELGNGYTAIFADASEIIALQIGDHDELGDLLWRK